MVRNTKFYGNNGQSLVDILIGLALLSLGISFAAILVFGGQDAVTERGNATEAQSLAEEGLNAAKLIFQNNWSAVSDGTHGLSFASGTWALSGAQDTQNIYTRQITVTSTDANTKDISSQVSWLTNPQRPQNVTLVGRVTNWKTIIATGGDACGGSLTGDWQNPRTLGSVDLGAGISATGLDVKDKIVYMSGTASTASKHDFFIVDATDGQNPRIVSSLNTGSGLNGIDAAGNYAYLANKSSTAQLQIIDISNISAPVLRSSLGLPGVSAYGNTIFYYDAKVFIGTLSTSGKEFHIINVADPLNPAILSSVEIGANVNAISVSGKMAYLALSADDEIRVFDISNPSSPQQAGAYFAPGNSEDGKTLFMVGTRMYLGRTLGSNHTNHHELHILDISSSSNITSFGSVNFLQNVNSVAVQDFLLFMGTSDSNAEFQMWNISNPANIVRTASFNFPQIGTAVDCENNFVYVAVRSNDALRIITSSP